EGEGAGDIVVGDDQRHLAPLVDVVADLAKLGHDPLVAPALEGPAQVDADDLAQHARVHTLGVVIRERHSASFQLSKDGARQQSSASSTMAPKALFALGLWSRRLSSRMRL